MYGWLVEASLYLRFFRVLPGIIESMLYNSFPRLLASINSVSKVTWKKYSGSDLPTVLKFLSNPSHGIHEGEISVIESVNNLWNNFYHNIFIDFFSWFSNTIKIDKPKKSLIIIIEKWVAHTRLYMIANVIFNFRQPHEFIFFVVTIIIMSNNASKSKY